MNLRQLEYFLAVAKSLSITGAAADLGVAQPTLTKSIRALEEELGVQLFDRLPRGVQLTEFGQSLFRHAETVNVQVQDAMSEIDWLRRGAVGTVSIGAGPAWLRRHLPLCLARTMARNPAIQARIVGGYDDILLRALRHGDLDFVVAELPSREASQDLAIERLTADELGPCCRADHPLARRDDLELAHLLEFPWILPPRSTRSHRRLQALFVAVDLPPPRIIVETESMAFILHMLRDSDALSFMGAMTLRWKEAQDLALLKVPKISAVRHAGLISRKDGWLSPAAMAIIAELRTICAADPKN
jgi:LysR family transcriptional regulator of gallate degradation